MAITRDAVNSGQNDGQSSITVSLTTGASATLLVVTSSAEDNTNASHLPITGVTFNGDALTKAIARDDVSAENDRTEIWYLLNPDIGTYNVVVSYTNVVDGCVVGVQSYNGVGSYDTATSTAVNATSGPAQHSITTAEANELLVDAAQTLSSSRTMTINSGQTANHNIQNAGQLKSVSSYEIVGAAGSYTQGYTLDASADWIVCIAAFKEASAGTVVKDIIGMGFIPFGR